jgi:hypothetical protein
MSRQINSNAVDGPETYPLDPDPLGLMSSESERRGDIMVRLPYRVRRHLQALAFQERTTVQKLMEKSINLLMGHYDKDPII